MPPHAPSEVTAISVVGVDARPILTTSKPMAHNVATTSFSTIGPERRASRPTTIVRDVRVVLAPMNFAYAAVNCNNVKRT